jgi:hypothetical protein
MKRKTTYWIQYLFLLSIVCAGCLKAWWYCCRINMDRSEMVWIAILLAICFLFGFVFIFNSKDKITRREIQNQWFLVIALVGLLIVFYIV